MAKHQETSIEKIRENFIEQIGLIVQSKGLPRIAGRLVGIFVFDGKPYSFSELAEKLQVSRGSVSSNARLLKELGVIKETARPGDRQTYFQLAENPYVDVLKGAANRAQQASDVVEKITTALPDSEVDTIKRIRAYQDFHKSIVAGLEQSMKIIQK